MRTQMGRRLACWAVASVTAGSTLLAGSGAAEASVGGVVDIRSDKVGVRSGPSTDFVSHKTKTDGDKVGILCKSKGQLHKGPKGESRTWLMVKSGGFLPAVKVRHAKPIPKCDYANRPPRSNHRSMNKAIDWQFRRLGSTGWEGMCLAFQRASFGWSSSGWYTAEEGGDWMANHGRMHKKGVPPRGALVWYHNSSGTGHVVVSLGKGKVIGTSVNGKVGIARYKYHDSYRGWSIPYFPKAG